MKNNTFEKDLLFVAERVTEGLNIYNETLCSQNKLLTTYGKDEFIALILNPYSDKEGLGQLRLRTRDMVATWDNVPVGFSQINESRGLLSDMKKAAHVSLKRNSLWYIDKEIKDTVGDRINFAEITTNKGWLYKVTFTNQYTIYLTLIKNDKDYLEPHDTSELYIISNKFKEPLSAPMTADECLIMLINIATQEDIRIAKFITISQQFGGKAVLSHSYRTENESFDEARAAFQNGYALKFKIKNSQMIVELYGTSEQGNVYILDMREFVDEKDIYAAVEEFSKYPKYKPKYSEE